MARTIININSPVDLIANEQLKYDVAVHRYRVTKEGYDKNTNTSIVLQEGSDEDADLQVIRISDLIYTYMYSKMDTGDDIENTEFRISRDKNLAEALKTAMIQMYESDLITGAVKIYYQHGIDQGISREDLLDSAVPPIVRDTLENATLLKNRYGIRVPDDKYREGY